MSKWFRDNRALYPADWDAISDRIKSLAAWRCEACDIPHSAPPYVLTTHHIDHTPANCDDANLVALCQVCHLRAHGKHYRELDRSHLLAELRRRYEIELRQLCLPLSIGEV